ncbi:MAG: ribonuclease P protein component [Candidatus Parcubacteria bacterium]|nr:ribonuclease P protein component [Candidatus Parcubacteria bacterium]
MLAKKNRINKKLFEEIFKRGKIFSSPNLSLKIAPTTEKQSRFTFVVSSKVAKRAVDRNKIKRRARNIVRKFLPEIKKQINAIIFFRKGAGKMTFSELEKEINDIFNF